MDTARFIFNKDETSVGQYCFMPDARDNNNLRLFNDRFIAVQVEVIHDSTFNYKSQL